MSCSSATRPPSGRWLAAAILLVVVAALGRGFALVGDVNRGRRVTVHTSSAGHDWWVALRSDLNRLTVSMDSSTSLAGDGYFLFQEGPASDSAPNALGPNALSPNLSGDTDDVLAFTARAPGDSFYSGTVPWGVLEAARAQTLGAAYTLPDHYDPRSPRIIQGQCAEVILFPHGRSLHRRVLLVRPDLNVTASRLSTAGVTQVGFESLPPDQPILGFMRADAAVEPCGFPGRSLDSAAIETDALDNSPNRLAGMARVQQSIDLSLSRPSGNDLNFESAERLSPWYTANTLTMLRDPQNRFAQLGMIDAPAGDFLTGLAALQTEYLLSGERAGEDVVSPGMLAFDLRWFDPRAPVYITAGADAQPGVLGADDDGNGVIDDRSELGAMHSDDQIVTPGDERFAEAARGGIIADPISHGVFVDSTQSGTKIYDAGTAKSPLRSLKVMFRRYDDVTDQIDQLEFVRDFLHVPARSSGR